MKKDWWKLLVTLAASFAAAGIGSLFTINSIPTWYANLNRTFLTPPNWVFGPVWTLLYILMAIAAYLVWHQTKDKITVKQGLVFWSEQLILNAVWSIIFFGGHQIFLGFITIIVLWLVILATIVWFFRVSRLAGWLMIPYILWVSFATLLNYSIWLVNR